MTLTYAQLDETVTAFAAGLLELGLQPEEHVSLFSENSHRWLIADLGLQAIGCVPCVRGGTTAPAEELTYILGAGSGSRAAIVQDPPTARKLKAFFSAGGAGYSALTASLEHAEPIRFLVLLRDYGDEAAAVEDVCKVLGGLPVFTYAQVLERGRASATARLRVDALRAALVPDRPLTVSYTSGTTGYPKGVVLTGANMMSQVRHFDAFVPIEPGDRVMSMLPVRARGSVRGLGHQLICLGQSINFFVEFHSFVRDCVHTFAAFRMYPTLTRTCMYPRSQPRTQPWHIYERAATYYVLSRGAHLLYSSVKRLAGDLPNTGADYLVTVPLVLSTLHDRVRATISKAPALRRLVASALIAASIAFVRARRVLEGMDVRLALARGSIVASMLARVTALLTSVLLAPLALLARRLVFAKVLQGLNIRKGVISGGGSLAEHLDDFFEAAGLPVVNGYGLTETSPVIACRSLALNPRGTVGALLPGGTRVRVVDPEDLSRSLPRGQRGLLLVKGPNVFSHYYRDPRRTDLAFRAGDRWFDTGDLGVLIPHSPSHKLGGTLVLTGRLKDTIVLKSGENVEPQPLEDAISCSPLIKQVVVVGQDQRYLGALVVPDKEYLAALAEEQGRAEGFTDREIEDKIYSEVSGNMRHCIVVVYVENPFFFSV